MSIILEALKKAAKEENDITAKTTNEISQPEVKSPEAQTPKPDALHLNRPTLIVLVTILGVGFLLSFIFTGHDVTSEKRHRQEVKTSALTATTTGNSTAEGYIPPRPIPKQESQPITIFKPLISNPKLSLSGIIYGIGKPTAIIENRIVEEGESIKGAKVVKIYTDYVELLNESSGKTFILKIR